MSDNNNQTTEEKDLLTLCEAYNQLFIKAKKNSKVPRHLMDDRIIQAIEEARPFL